MRESSTGFKQMTGHTRKMAKGFRRKGKATEVTRIQSKGHERSMRRKTKRTETEIGETSEGHEKTNGKEQN